MTYDPGLDPGPDPKLRKPAVKPKPKPWGTYADRELTAWRLAEARAARVES